MELKSEIPERDTRPLWAKPHMVNFHCSCWGYGQPGVPGNTSGQATRW